MTASSEPVAAGPVSGAVQKAERIVSIDALRGFDMFWIMGADHIVRGLGEVNQSGWAQSVSRQLEHVRWEGFVFYDLIFPLFVFLLGMGVVFSLGRIIEKEGKLGAYKRIFRRFALMFLLGALYDDGLIGLPDESPFSGVLQRLAWCYLFTSLLYANLKLKGLIAVCVTILLGYWVLVGFVPPPGTDKVDLTTRDVPNMVFYVDEHFLPFKEGGQRWDPEGLLSTVPAIASCLLGVFAGLLLTNREIDPKRKIMMFIGAGVVLLMLGYGWGMWFPVIKRIWTSSYVLVAAGYSSILVGLFYLVVDYLGYRKWAIPFIWIGVNPLTLYLAENVIDFHDLGGRIAGGPVAAMFGSYGELWVTCAGLFLIIMLARFLFKKGIFLRV